MQLPAGGQQRTLHPKEGGHHQRHPPSALTACKCCNPDSQLTSGGVDPMHPCHLIGARIASCTCLSICMSAGIHGIGKRITVAMMYRKHNHHAAAAAMKCVVV
mmetsp:Transcript_22208/g.48502  ORF Transcript_22208/g.48502 Transcript_22208/m.48502 type:complete len:103 (-) Transcript_22208:2510-2818(-)